MLLLQEFEFEVIFHPGTQQHLTANYLSRLDSSKVLDGISDDLPDAHPLVVLPNLLPDDLIHSDSDFLNVPWIWFEEMYHFLNTKKISPFLPQTHCRCLALCSR